MLFLEPTAPKRIVNSTPGKMPPLPGVMSSPKDRLQSSPGTGAPGKHRHDPQLSLSHFLPRRRRNRSSQIQGRDLNPLLSSARRNWNDFCDRPFKYPVQISVIPSMSSKRSKSSDPSPLLIPKNNLWQKMSEVILLREKVAQAELETRGHSAEVSLPRGRPRDRASQLDQGNRLVVQGIAAIGATG